MIKKTNNQVKIIVAIIILVLISGGMFLYGFGIMASKNEVIASTIAQRNIELEVLQREQKSFEQGKKDLSLLEKSEFPPDELFSSDTKVVKEIQTLETSAKKYDIELSIQVSGSLKEAKPVAGTNSALVAIPYTMTLKGKFENILLFVQSTERMPFITHILNLSIVADEDDKTLATIASEFYIKK
jgi:hypothetical protein